ncbi:two-component response regulator-like PRR73 [Selaginella moellendorffii]|uniref:two-component response regulator-like PRR73 n=1 Tax=Selaginella moellendorffii TaxID=88036 RepID=UPI000D1CBBC2|nr:two-component response regulator-like PRR73 [Selaginella moellendorffii]|eukprot:XP_024515485.1 two-component response regulator-like PRR73 [Selaginella moellendorffii]
MAAMTESELSMLSSQYALEPLTFLDNNHSMIELDDLVFLENDLDNDLDGIAGTNFQGTDILGALPQHYNGAHIQDESKQAISSSSPTRKPSFSAVSEELNSLSLDQLIAATPLSNKRISSSPLASPKKQHQIGKELPPVVVDSKDGILRNSGSGKAGLYESPLGGSLVYGGIGGHGGDVSRRPYVMQRSYSSHALGQLPSISSATPGAATNGTSALDSTMQGLHACSGSIVPSLSQLLEVKEGDGIEIDVMRRSPSSGCFSPCSNSMRRVCSTGDIQRMNTSLQSEGQDECGFKIGRYSLAERRERIHRYRQKRSERNFNKKIKYACRKTLADSRPRVRGRFAKNEDVVDSSVASSGASGSARASKMRAGGEYEDEVDALLEDDEGLLIDRQSSGELSECWGLGGGGGGIGIAR